MMVVARPAADKVRPGPSPRPPTSWVCVSAGACRDGRVYQWPKGPGGIVAWPRRSLIALCRDSRARHMSPLSIQAAEPQADATSSAHLGGARPYVDQADTSLIRKRALTPARPGLVCADRLRVCSPLLRDAAGLARPASRMVLCVLTRPRGRQLCLSQEALRHGPLLRDSHVCGF